MKQVLIWVMVVLAAASAGYFLRPLIQPEAEQKAMADPITIISDEEALEIYKKSMKMLETEGPNPARAYLKKHFDRTGHVWLLFGIAWFDFIDQKFDDSFTKAEFVAIKATDPSLEASATYLLGYLSTMQEEYDQAKGYFFRSLKIREGTNRTSEVQKIYRALADLELQQGNISEADSYLNKILTMPSKNDPFIQAFILHLQEEILIARGQYQKALEPCRKAERLFEEQGNTPNKIFKVLHRAYILALLGNVLEAEQLTQAAQKEAFEIDQDLFSFQLKVNYYLIEKVKGGDYGALEQDLEAVSRKPDFAAMKLRFKIARSYTNQE